MFPQPGCQQLLITWCHNKYAWMTFELFADWGRTFNRKMSVQERHVLLFLDNAPAHPKDLKLSYIKLQYMYMPSNTSTLQSLDLGVIEALKKQYQTYLLRFTVTHVDSETAASEVKNKVTVLHAAKWLASAVNAVNPGTVQHCFWKAGVNPDAPVANDSEDDLPLSHLLAELRPHMHELVDELEYPSLY